MYLFFIFKKYEPKILFNINVAKKDYNTAKERIKHNKARLIINNIKKI